MEVEDRVKGKDPLSLGHLPWLSWKMYFLSLGSMDEFYVMFSQTYTDSMENSSGILSWFPIS